MEFSNETQKAHFEKIGAYMKDLFGEMGGTLNNYPGYYLMMGSAIINVFILPWGDKETVVNCRAYVVTGAERSKEMLEYLLRENYDMRFGAFGLDKEGAVTFEQNIVGSTCDKNELKASIMAVLGTADKYDDEIVSRWGGKRASDR